MSAATTVPVLHLGLAGHSSLTALLIGGFFLGIGGTAFAVGVPLVSAWFPPERRGLAIGVFGASTGGTALSALTTVKLVDANSMSTPFLITAAVLALYAAAARLLRDAPGRTVPTESAARRPAARQQAARAPRGRQNRLRTGGQTGGSERRRPPARLPAPALLQLHAGAHCRSSRRGRSSGSCAWSRTRRRARPRTR